MAERTLLAPPRLDDIESRVTLSMEEVAQLLGMGRTATYEAARRGEIPTRRLGRRVVVPVPALLEWLGASSAS
jgi:excisionase family DNA binding protein